LLGSQKTIGDPDVASPEIYYGNSW
jgi:hypothetical protein